MAIHMLVLYVLLVLASASWQPPGHHDAGLGARRDAVMGFSHLRHIPQMFAEGPRPPRPRLMSRICPATIRPTATLLRGNDRAITAH